MKVQRVLIGGFAIVLGGCSSTMQDQFQYIDRTITVVMPDDTYRVREHPQRDRLMVTPSWSTITSVGAQRGLTLGTSGDLPKGYEAAARQHMVNTGRAHCRLLSSRALMDPHKEVVFDCSAAPAPDAPPS